MTRAHVRLLGPCFKTGREECRHGQPRTLCKPFPNARRLADADRAIALAPLSLEEAVKTTATSPGDWVGSGNGAVPRPGATFAMVPTDAGSPKTGANARTPPLA